LAGVGEKDRFREDLPMRIISELKIAQGILRLVQGDITEREVDAIVNAANSHLQHGGGVAGAIVKKGGQIIQEESDKIGFTPAGTAVITGGGSLPARFVVHAVGPRMGEGDEDHKLKNAVLNSLLLASQNNLGSISFPAISSGIFGFPKDRCAKILVSVAAEFLRTHPNGPPRIIEFCIYDDTTLAFFRKEFDALSRPE
jgi:O-acetyl-ADP-ribose deacetylase (regulator of RNase III)